MPERQLGSLRRVIDNKRHDGGTPSADSIATELSSMPSTTQCASVLLALQQTHGNQYVQRVVAGVGVQAKLEVGQQGDIYEQEADRMAIFASRASNSSPIFGATQRTLKVGPVNNIMQRRPDDGTGELKLKEPKLSFGPELGLEKSILDLKLKLRSPKLVLPPSELCEKLAEEWARNWFLMQKLPMPEPGIFSQIVNALKGKVEEWVPKGRTYFTDPTRAEEVARLEAVKIVLKRFEKLAEAKPGKEEEAREKLEEERLEKQLEKIKEKILEAF